MIRESGLWVDGRGVVGGEGGGGGRENSEQYSVSTPIPNRRKNGRGQRTLK